MTEKRKPTYEQALALERGQAAARRAARERAVFGSPALTDETRLAFMRKFTTATLESRLGSKHTPATDKQAIRAVLAEREAH